MFAYDLLEQSRHLILKEPRKPLQVSLRRGVSAAYYAVIHLLIEDGSNLLTSGAVKKTFAIQLMNRAFQHGQMKNVCEEIAKQNMRSSYQKALSAKHSLNLKTLAKIFIELQKARHLADYDRFQKINRFEALNQHFKAESAFQLWQTIRQPDEAPVFDSLLLFGRPRD